MRANFFGEIHHEKDCSLENIRQQHVEFNGFETNSTHELS
jgi:hypothetical protein